MFCAYLSSAILWQAVELAPALTVSLLRFLFHSWNFQNLHFHADENTLFEEHSENLKFFVNLFYSL